MSNGLKKATAIPTSSSWQSLQSDYRHFCEHFKPNYASDGQFQDILGSRDGEPGDHLHLRQMDILEALRPKYHRRSAKTALLDRFVRQSHEKDEQ